MFGSKKNVFRYRRIFPLFSLQIVLLYATAFIALNSGRYPLSLNELLRFLAALCGCPPAFMPASN